MCAYGPEQELMTEMGKERLEIYENRVGNGLSEAVI